MRVNQQLMEKYPRPLSNMEKKKLKTTEERDELNDYAQQMYGGDDSDEEL
jgi:hypothetical protein